MAGDETLVCRRLINLSGIDNYAEHHEDGLRNAISSLTIARRVGNAQLESQALYYAAASHMLLGHSADAVADAQAGIEAALRIDDTWGEMSATTVLLLVKVISRQFDGARELADRLAALSAPLGNMTLATGVLYRAWLCYAVDRTSEMDECLTEAERLFEESASGSTRDDNQGIATETLRFELAYTRTLLDLLLGRWSAVLEREPLLTRIADALRRPHIENVARMSTIDALLGRGGSGDAQRAIELAERLHHIDRAPSPEGWSDCWELSLARAAARVRRDESRELITQARQTLDRNAPDAPLVIDRSYAALATAATDAGDLALAAELLATSVEQRTMRAASAGSLWGGAA
jgi:hypothetical protein